MKCLIYSIEEQSYTHCYLLCVSAVLNHGYPLSVIQTHRQPASVCGVENGILNGGHNIYMIYYSYTNSNMLSIGLLETRMIGNVSQYHKTFSKTDNNVLHRWNQVLVTC